VKLIPPNSFFPVSAINPHRKNTDAQRTPLFDESPLSFCFICSLYSIFSFITGELPSGELPILSLHKLFFPASLLQNPGIFSNAPMRNIEGREDAIPQLVY